MKTFYILGSIGKSKYVVNFHDGHKSHDDGSPFFDIAIFSNKKRMNDFISDLSSFGYVKI